MPLFYFFYLLKKKRQSTGLFKTLPGPNNLNSRILF